MNLPVRSTLIAAGITATVLISSLFFTSYFGNNLTKEIDIYDWAKNNEPVAPYIFNMESQGGINYNISQKLYNKTDFQLTYMLNDSWMIRSRYAPDLNNGSNWEYSLYDSFRFNSSIANEIGRSLKLTVNQLKNYDYRIHVNFKHGYEDWIAEENFSNSIMASHQSYSHIWFEFYGLDSIYVVMELFQFGIIIGSGNAYQEGAHGSHMPLDDEMMSKIRYDTNFGWSGQFALGRGNIYNFYYIEFNNSSVPLNLPLIATLNQFYTNQTLGA